MEKPKSGHVYFIQAGKGGPIKIGYSGNNPIYRLNAIQTGNHESLRLLAYFDAPLAMEGSLHEKFSELRLRGEWFRPDPRLIGFIEGVATVAKTVAVDADEFGNEDETDTVFGLSHDQLQAARSYIELKEAIDVFNAGVSSATDHALKRALVAFVALEGMLQQIEQYGNGPLCDPVNAGTYGAGGHLSLGDAGDLLCGVREEIKRREEQSAGGGAR